MKLSMTVLFALAAATGTLRADDKPQQLAPTHADVSYGRQAKNVLDFWKAEGDGPRPLLVYIHGGGWTGGDKKQNPARIRPFLKMGISYAAVNDRLCPTRR